MTKPARLLEPRALCELTTPVRDAVWIAVGCFLLGLGVNALRPNGIPIVQRHDYEILVPCPETSGEVETIAPGDARLGTASTLIVDARAKSAFDAGHLPAATSVVFDYLEPTPAATLRQIAASGAQRVVVYGDGQDPDSGEQLARELSGKGIKNVGFVAGGAAALLGAERGASP